jgi:hypothetical protein
MYIPCIGRTRSTRGAELFTGQKNLDFFIKVTARCRKVHNLRTPNVLRDLCLWG